MDKSKRFIEALSEDELASLRTQAHARGLQREVSSAVAIGPQAEADVELRVGDTQKSLWFLARLNPKDSAYNLSTALLLRGELDVTALQHSLNELFARHQSLRSSFVAQLGQPQLQLLPESTGIVLHQHDLRDAANPEEACQALSKQLIETPFDLALGPLIRAHLLRLDEQSWRLLLVQQHIVSDGWSVGLMLDELFHDYRSLRDGDTGAPSPAPVLQYLDYLAWQDRQRQSGAWAAQRDYWRAALDGAPQLLTLPLDAPRPQQQSHAGDYLTFSLPGALVERLQGFAKERQASLFMVLLTGWAALLTRLSGQDEVVIGVPSANRDEEALQQVVGYISNTLPVRVEVAAEANAEQLLAQVRTRLLDAQRHQSLPLEQMIDVINPPRSLGHTPLFQVLVNWQSQAGASLSCARLEVSEQSCQLPVAQVKFDLELQLQQSAAGVDVQLGFATALFQRASVQRYAGYWQRLLQAMVETPQHALAQVALLDAAEREHLLYGFNQTEQAYPDACIPQLFERQVALTPEAPALRHAGQVLSYDELNQRANRLAQVLLARGVSPDEPVALCAERGVPMVLAILAIAKAGGAYLPLDPDYPGERLALMLEDAAPRLLLLDAAGATALQGQSLGIEALRLEAIEVAAQSAQNPSVAGLTPEHLAYIIYTSGSTGRPKGVLNQHGGLVNRLHWMQQAYALDASDVVLQKTPFGFDVSVWEFFWPLLNGACLEIAEPGGHKDPAYLTRLIIERQVSTVHFVPSMLARFLADPLAAECISLRHIICSGEALPAAVLKHCRQLLPKVAIHNLYGPTEAAIDVSAWTCPADFAGDQVPIGKPIANLRLYVLDHYLEPVPLGCVGELYIGGVGVARGYLRRPELNADRFIDDPFVATPGGRLYRTGDLVRQQHDGTLLFLGRNDHQVKLRGLRIELGEIEAQLDALPTVSESRVIVREDRPGDLRLVAYLVPAIAAPMDMQWLRQQLARSLPDYMLPAAFVCLDALPLSSNGKLDRRALPAPQYALNAQAREQVPLDEQQSLLVAICTELLGFEGIALEDNFFALGGHSLLAIEVIERLREEGFSADIGELFNAVDLGQFAATLQRITLSPQDTPQVETSSGLLLGGAVITPNQLPLIRLDASAIERLCATVDGGAANVQDIYPLSPLQDGLLFHHLLDGEGDPYLLVSQMAFADRATLEGFVDALQQVVARHDILRTGIVSTVSPTAQVVWRQARLQVREERLDPRDGPISEQLRRRFDPRRLRIDLERPPLLQLVLAEDVENQRWIALQLTHHLIGDHSTLEQILHEVGLIMAGRSAELAPPIPYRRLIKQLADDNEEERQRVYFQRCLGDIEQPSLAYGLADLHGSGEDVTDCHWPLPAALNQRLRDQSRRLGVSLASLCHLAWARVVAATSGVSQAVFGTVLFGRMASQGHSGAALGLFINTLPLRVDIDQRELSQAARDTHQALLELLRYEHASLSLAQRCSGVAAPTPLFNTLLNYRHNQASLSSLQESGLLVGIKPLDERERTNYPLAMAVEDNGVSLALTAQARRPVASQELCESMACVLEHLANALEQGTPLSLGQLPVLSQERQQRLLRNSLPVPVAFDSTQSVVSLFEAQAQRTPQALALYDEQRRLSYQELNEQANQLAHTLLAAGSGPGQVVALCAERGVSMVLGLLATLKAGAAYLALDVDYPAERLAFIIEDAAPLLLLVDTRGEVALAGRAEALPRLALQADPSGARHAPQSLLTAQSPAYLTYTSGSSGQPKGVWVSHGNLLNHTLWQHGAFALGPDDVFLQRTSISFDASVWELWTPLTLGASLYVLPGAAMRDLSALLECVVREGITVMQAVPSLLSSLPPEQLRRLGEGALRYMFCGGEALPGQLANRLLELVGEAVVNLYGPTEATIDTTFQIIREPLEDAVVAIGRPIANACVYLLDAHLQWVPEGAVGEICIGGAGVALGYHERATLDAERFVTDSLAGRLYRSGDLGRWRADGSLQFLGRLDQQVKIRGYRIEPGEIEQHLQVLPGVAEAVVLVHEGQLVAYLRARDGQPLAAGVLREALARRLPRHMLPAWFVGLDEWPRLPNGKLDRAALPAPNEAVSSNPYEAPQGVREQFLAAIWSELLGLPRVGRQDDFFTLGGHSLLLLRLLNRIAEQGYARPSLNELFAQPSLVRMAELLDDDAATAPLAAIPLLAQGASRPLSFAQQRLWFLHQLEPANPAYHIPGALRLQGELQVEALQQALAQLGERHEVLRMRFASAGGQVVAELLPSGSAMVLERSDLSASADPQQALDELAQRLLRRPFDLTLGPLWRAHLVRLAESQWQLFLVLHHAICDAWSTQILLGELQALYNANRRGAAAQLPNLSLQYADYAAWQRERLDGPAGAQLADYWRRQLAEPPAPLVLPESRPRPQRLEGRAGSHALRLSPELTLSLRELSQANGCTLFMTLLAGWALLLARLADRHDLVIGTHGSNRPHPQTEALLGLFVNSLALRFDASGAPSIGQWLASTRDTVLAAQEHQEFPFERVVELLNPPRSLNHTPLFQIAFNWHAEAPAPLSFDGMHAQGLSLVLPATKYDMTLQLQDCGQCIEGALDYNAELFDAETIERYQGYLLRLLEQMCADVQQSIEAPDLLDAVQRRALLQIGSGAQQTLDDEALAQLFERQARSTPDTLALIADDQCLSYRQLNALANRLAHYLLDVGLPAQAPVALCVGRNSWIAVGILAVLKAGGVYLPLDPAYAGERLKQIITDADPALVLGDAEGLRALGELPQRRKVLLALDQPWQSQPDNDPIPRSGCADLAYILYTSGSSGRPKGVMVEQRSVVNFWRALGDGIYRSLEPGSRIALNASFSFDMSLKGLSQLLSGHTLVILGQTLRTSGSALLAYLQTQRIDGLDITPAQLSLLIAAGLLQQPLPGLLRLLIGGEPLSVRQWQQLQACEHLDCVNMYGPTEATVDVSIGAITRDEPLPHIGTAIRNARLYLLDAQGRLVPRGCVGELYLGGPGVARGYLGQARLSAERFLADPFVGGDARMYRSGDLARWRPDGNLEYLGRNDQQVKLRGFRIELGEIQARLLELPGVHEALVVVRGEEAAQQRLVAYFSCHHAPSDHPALLHEMYQGLRAVLPAYMLPAAFVWLPELPHTENGKFDRRSLPEPKAGDFIQNRFEAPESEDEVLLATIWQELFGIEQVGRKDDFFALGGHSLLAVELIERLRRHGLSLDVQTLFASPLLETLAGSLQRHLEVVVPVNPITPHSLAITPDMLPLIDLNEQDIETIVASVDGGLRNVQDIYALSPLQDGILFHHMLAGEGDPYLQRSVLGFASRDELLAYLTALEQVVARHDILRTAVLWQGLSQPAQVVWREVSVQARQIELPGQTGDVLEALFALYDPQQSRIALDVAPLMRFEYCPDPANQRWLLLQRVHHLICDHGTMMRVAAEVEALLHGRGDSLAPPVAFRELIAQTHQALDREEQQRFFSAQLGDIVEPTLPFGLADTYLDGRAIADHHLRLPDTLDRRLRQSARQAGVSLASLCHLAWARVLGACSGQQAVVFGTVLLGRMHASSSAAQGMGVFINTLPVRIDVDGRSVLQALRDTQRTLAQTLRHEHASLALAQRCSGLPGQVPLFSALLNYRHNQHEKSETRDGPLASIEWLKGEERSNYPLILSVEDYGDSLGLTAQVVEPLGAQRICALMQQALVALVEALELGGQGAFGRISVLPAAERQLSLRDYNRTHVEFPRGRCVPQLFEEQARRTPQAIALVDGDREFSYQALNQAANRLALHLLETGRQAGERIAVLLERSAEQVIAQLAISKLGACIVPLDPKAMAARQRYMLEDTGASLLLTLERYRALELGAVAYLLLDTFDAQGPAHDLTPRGTAEDPLYVLYTSGSTGTPKGVLIPHRAINRLVLNGSYIDIRSDDRIAYEVNPSFDTVLFELWGALLNGATLVVLSDADKIDPQALTQALRRDRISILWQTSGLFASLAASMAEEYPRLRALMAGGDVLDLDATRQVLGSAAPPLLINAYGPTECTTFASSYRLRAVPEGTRAVPIGRPISNTSIYLLDSWQQPVPLGAAGEICIGGDGVALGYLNLPEVSAERFLADPFAADPQARLYRTGDFGRWNADGELEFLGRKDQMVKIRGYRVELGEIETHLTRLEGIDRAVVLYVASGSEEAQLVAYYTVTAEQHLEPAELRSKLALQLPEHMVPLAYRRVDGFALTPNGKLDRRLPPPTPQDFVASPYEAPREGMETAMAALWGELLGMATVGRQDNFFNLGGHSLLAIRLIARLQQTFGLRLPLARLFDHATLAAFSEQVLVAALAQQTAAADRQSRT